MIIRICSFTRSGAETAQLLREKCQNFIWESPGSSDNLDAWTEESMAMHAPLIFVGATGIAVRKIAPYVKDKLTDSPVLVIDEGGRFVIPLLSGHVGGANELARLFADVLRAEAVITTATDVRGLFSVDVFAQKNGFKILNRQGIKKVSEKLLESGKISMIIEPTVEYDSEAVPPCIEIRQFGPDTEADVSVQTSPCLHKKALLTISIKPYVLGLGCKKNTDFTKLEEFVAEVLHKNNIETDDISRLASIDLKKEEYALHRFETCYRIPFLVFSAEQLEKTEGEFSESGFVKKVTGVGNVCERAAMLAAGPGSSIVVPKTASDGMTLSVCKRMARIETWET